MHRSAIGVGAGIVGLATARALARRKYDVKVIERTDRAMGASIRNFGMIWPVGQPDGQLYERALLSSNIWKAISSIPSYLHAKYGVEFLWGKVVTELSYPSVFAADEEFQADEIYVCSGADFETLYPSFYSGIEVTKCKLQMMRIAAQPGNERIGPALCGGLSLVHYKSFGAADLVSL